MKMPANQTMEIICVYNSLELYEQMVFSTKEFTDAYLRIIGLDNRQKQFASAAEAYNHAIDCLCDAEVLVFCHQDIIWNVDALRDVYYSCLNNYNTLFGAAGVYRGLIKNHGTVSAITHPGHTFTTLAKSEKKSVFTLDELMVAGNKEVFTKVRFDPLTCFAWDYYAVDLCLQCHVKGVDVVAIGLDIQHLSCGHVTDNFIKTQKRMAQKHRKNYCIIYSTCGWFFTYRFLYEFGEKVKTGVFFNKILRPIKHFIWYCKEKR